MEAFQFVIVNRPLIEETVHVMSEPSCHWMSGPMQEQIVAFSQIVGDSIFQCMVLTLFHSAMYHGFIMISLQQFSQLTA